VRKTFVLTKSEVGTLLLVSKLQARILTEGLTKENTEDLKDLNGELNEIICKFKPDCSIPDLNVLAECGYIII